MLVADVQSLLRRFGGHREQPTAVCIDSRTLQSTPESGACAGYDGAKRRKGSKVHIAVDTFGYPLALKVTAADEGDRTQVAALAEDIQQMTGNRDIPEPAPPKTHNSTASAWRWSNILWPGAASSCCRDAGWWREALSEPQDSEDSHAIMSASTPASRDCTTSPSLPSWSRAWSKPSHKRR